MRYLAVFMVLGVMFVVVIFCVDWGRMGVMTSSEKLNERIDVTRFPWAFGTDAIVWVDGRWSQWRAVQYLEDRAREYCDIYNRRATIKIEWRRSVYLLGGRYRSITV